MAALVFTVTPIASAEAAPLKGMWGPVQLPGGVSEFQVDQDLGANLYEIQLPWASVAPTRPSNPVNPRDPAYQWPAAVDTAVASAPVHGMRVAVMLIGAPPWANGGRPFNWAPKKTRDYANFATAAARRYPSVHLWMVWGEPTRAHNYEPLFKAAPFKALTKRQAGTPHRYARMLDSAYGALKRSSSANIVIGGMSYTSGDVNTRQWIDNLKLPSGQPPRMDLYGHNPFSFRKPNLANPPSPLEFVDFSDLGRLSRLVNKKLRRKNHIKLFLSEFTIPTAADSEFNFHVSPDTQADWINSAFSIARTTPSIFALGWIHLIDDGPGGSAGGLLDAQGMKKPGYFAFQRG